MRSLFPVASLLLVSCTAREAGEVSVTNAWAQPFDKTGSSAAVYMTITVTCAVPDKLLSARARAPQQASLHASRVADNALSMTPVRSIALPCGEQVPLKPMGHHVFVTGIGKPLGIGDRIPLTLSFERAGEVEVTADVTTMAMMEDVDPMHMHGGTTKAGGMDHMHMH